MFNVQDLAQFTGTENYYKHWTGKLVMTDGVHYILDGASWLVDIIASVQHLPKVSKAPFQLWELEKKDDNSATVKVREDSGDEFPVLYKQEIEYTDFPLKEFKLYLIDDGSNKVLLLPSEY